MHQLNTQQQHQLPGQRLRPQKPVGIESNQPQKDHSISISGEDDLTRLFTLSPRAFDDLEIHNHATISHDHARHLSAIAAAFDDYYTFAPALGELSDECAVCSDDDEDDFSTTPGTEHELEPHTMRPREETTATDLTPSFVGEKEKEINHHSGLGAESAPAAVDVVPSTKHVRKIPGRLMSLWPLPLEDERIDFGEETEMEYVAIPSHEVQHDSSGEKQLMSWWPVPESVLQYEWNERFYE